MGKQLTNTDRRIDALDKQLEALDMRKAGFTYQDIADKVGYKFPSGAQKAVESALKKTLQEPADKVRELELARLDDLINSLWIYRARPQYTDRILRIMERRSKLLGLDAPTKTDVTSDGGPIILKVIYDNK